MMRPSSASMPGPAKAKVLAFAPAFVETLDAARDAAASRRRNDESLRMAKGEVERNERGAV
jgi:hypothetical protein